MPASRVPWLISVPMMRFRSPISTTSCPGLLEERERVFFAMGSDPAFDKRVSDWVSQVRSRARAGVHGPIEFLALDHFLHDMRLYKSRAEVAVMRRAARLSAQAHTRTDAAL